MNKEFLKKLKELLIKQKKKEERAIPTTSKKDSNKKYTIYDGIIYDIDTDYLGTQKIQTYSKEEIISKINTNEAIIFFNDSIKEYIDFLTNKGATYDEIEITIAPTVFMDVEFMKEKTIKEKTQIKDNILYDITPIIIHFFAYRYYQNQKINITNDNFDYNYLPKMPKMLPNIQESNCHITKYNDFVNELKRLGYNLNAETFDDMIKYHTNNDNTVINNIIINFAKENTRKL